jgi:hypothetical protein
MSARARLADAWRTQQVQLAALVPALRNRRLFDQVERYCMFLGHARSGSTLVGAVLTAHPDMVIAHELGAFRYVRHGASRNQLFQLLVDRDRRFAHLPQQSTGYHYGVPGQWQGRIRDLKVIGDKKAGASTRRLGERPEVLEKLRKVVRVPLRIVHVTRNPYDNITTMARRSGRSLDAAIDRYFLRSATVERVRASSPADMITVQHEEFVREPAQNLAGLCLFLGVTPDPDYLAACAAIVRAEPHRTRDEGDWTPAYISRVAELMTAYRFLDGYTFDR